MPRLSIKTRNNATHRNKPLFYFCAHPDEGEALIGPASKDIWSVCDAALCYDGAPYGADIGAAFLGSLDGVRLLVVAVTEKFLTEASYARDVVLPYLSSRHVPVLPIVREEIREGLFEEVFGERQYLNAEHPSYRQQLTRFIRTLLPADETVVEIRSAFSAYIFLSYRKVDRAAARELIRKIHSNEVCRDVAIWYDDFLTPGEDFNEEIAEAIRKCNLFAMAVTPNIVKGENYVVKIEYPFAQEKNKAILPIECTKTDRARLADCFSEIPECIGEGDADGLAAALYEALHGYQHRREPMYDYLIGLAHLNGIDVELDHALAFERISAAANAGLFRAQRKLVDMLWCGDGAEIDREAALRMQKRLVEGLRAAYERKNTESNAIEYARASYRMAELLANVMRFEEALPYARRARSIIDDLQLKNKEYEAMLAEYAIKCAEIHAHLGQEVRAMLFMLEAMLYCYDSEKPTETRRTLITALLAMPESQRKSWDQDAMKKMLGIAEDVYRETEDEFDRGQLLECLEWAMRTEKNESCRRKIAERIFMLYSEEEIPELPTRLQGILATVYIYMSLNATDDTDSVFYFEKALALTDAHPHSYAMCETRAAAYFARAALLYEKGQRNEAHPTILRAIDCLRPIAEESGDCQQYENLFMLELWRDIIEGKNEGDALASYMRRWECLCRENPKNRLYKKRYRALKRGRLIARVKKLFKRKRRDS